MTYVTKKYLADWLYAAGIRALKTAAQVALTMFPTTAFTLGEVNWILVTSTAGGAAILSLVTSLAGIPEVSDGENVATLYAKGEGKHAREE